jgi:hypothetical protein
VAHGGPGRRHDEGARSRRRARLPRRIPGEEEALLQAPALRWRYGGGRRSAVVGRKQ